MKTERPIIEIEKESLDQTLEVLGLISLIFLIAYPAFHFSALPDPVPSHFNASGEVDAYSSKWTIFILPAIGLALHLFFHWFKKIPHKYNYPGKITAANAAAQYKIAVRMMRFFQTSISFSLAYITLTIVQTAKGNVMGLGPYFLPMFMAIFIGGAIYFALKAANQSKK